MIFFADTVFSAPIPRHRLDRAAGERIRYYQLALKRLKTVGFSGSVT
jgi:hypothetical protein